MKYKELVEYLREDKEKFKQLVIGKEMANMKTDHTTLLITCMKIGDIETFEYLISQGADVNAQVVSTMDYALNWCDDERIEFAKILLKNGANPNLLTISGYHSLIVAMSSEDFNLAKLLIKNEADLNIVDDDRDSFINYLIRYDNYDLRSFIPLVDARIDTLTEENKRKYKGWKFATILL